MDKGHLQAVLARINAAPEGSEIPLTVEEAGLLHAFVTVRQRSAEVSAREKALLDRIEAILALWRAPSEPDAETQRRHQTMLRKAIDKAQQQHWDALQADEIALLRSTHHMLSDLSGPNKGNERLFLLLTDLLQRYDTRCTERREAGATAGAGSVAEMFGEQCVSLLGIAPPKPEAPVAVLQASSYFHGVTPAAVGFVGGCAVSLTVRTFEVTGPTRIEGDIPSDVLLRVKDGSLMIEGFVSGHIVTDGNIIVRGNVQGGWVIATRGSILLDRALLGAHVIAEGGAVWCSSVESAACVFGWKGVAVKETVLSSFLGGGSIWVGDKVAGTRVEACGPVVTPTIESVNAGPSTVCLEREISSEVYGRHMSDDVLAMRRTVLQHERTIQRGERMMRYVRMLSQNCYRTAIFYLVGGVGAASVAPEFQEMQSFALHLEELQNNAEGASRFYTRLFSGAEHVDADEVEFFTSEMLKSLAYISQQAESAAQEFQSRIHHSMEQHIRTFSRGLRYLQRNVDNPKGSQYFQDVFLRNVREWQDLFAKTRGKVEALEATFQVHPDLLERIRAERNSLDKLLSEVMLQTSLESSSGEVVRAHSPLIRVLLSTVDRNRKSIQHVQEEVEHARQDLARIRKQIEEMTAVLYSDSNPDSVYLEAAVIEVGTIVTTDPELRQGVDGTMREVIVLQQPVQGKTRFILDRSLIRRVDCHL